MSDDTSINNLARRRLLQTGLVGVGGLGLGALAANGAAAQTAAPLKTSCTSLPIDAMDPKAPPGYKKGDMLDNRYPVTYERSVPAAVEVLTRHFAAISARNLEAIADTLHFPFAVYEQFSIRMPVIVKTKEEFMRKPPASVGTTLKPVRFSDQDSWLRPGLYDVLVGMEVLQFDPTMVNMAMTYDRYDEDGHRILRNQSVYCVTNNDGRWAIQLFSTIFTPELDIGVEWPDAVAAAFRPRMNHVLGIWDDDNEILPRLARHNSIPRAGITGGGLGNLTGNAVNDPMAAFRIKGVKTRLSITETEQPRRPQPEPPPGTPRKTRWDNAQDGFEAIGKGERGGSTVKMRDARILHHTANKVHLVSGVERWNTNGEELSTTMQVLVVTYKKGIWAIDTSLGYITTHARINNIPSTKG